MAVRPSDWSPGEILTASDLNDSLASKLPYSYGTATPSTTDSGFLWYDSNSTPAAPKFWDGAAFQALTSGKILQVVRATDATVRTTTSLTYVDANLSVTITPTKTTSAVLLIAAVKARGSGGSFNGIKISITDSSNNAISGAEDAWNYTGDSGTTSVNLAIVGYSQPATTSAVTYKLRFGIINSGTAELSNDENTGQLYAIEVSA